MSEKTFAGLQNRAYHDLVGFWKELNNSQIRNKDVTPTNSPEQRRSARNGSVPAYTGSRDRGGLPR